MIIAHNMPAFNAKRSYNKNSSKLAKSLEKLSSGYSINRAADNAAGLAVSEKMRSQIVGIKQSVHNCEDGISLVQTFEGALGETVSIIHRAKSLAVQMANGSYQDQVDREAVQIEYNQLCDEIDHIADTDFNGLVMLNGRKMADGFTFLTENGTMWLTPSKCEFREGSFINNFDVAAKSFENVPDPEMNIRIAPGIKEKMTEDKELMEALKALNEASVRASYDHVIPKFSLENLPEEFRDKITIETSGNNGVIRVTTEKSGTVDVAYVECSELPHYASSSARGKWVGGSAASGSYLSVTDPYTESYDGNAKWLENGSLEKWTESYVNQTNDKGVTRAERERYLEWVKATPSQKANMTHDDTFDRDLDDFLYTWTQDGQTYKNTMPESRDPQAVRDPSDKLKVYGDDYDGGPQIFFHNVDFIYEDEDVRDDAYLELYVTSRSWSASTTYGGKQYVGGGDYYDTDFYTETWLDHGSVSLTLEYDRDTDMWKDSITNEWHDWDYYGLDNRYYNYSKELIERDSYYRNLDAKNLYHIEDANGGKLPDGFTLSVGSLSAPKYRTYTSSATHFDENRAHTDYTNGGINYNDLKLEEYDPADPSKGGVDYTVARDGAVYTYDGVKGAWTDEGGNIVDLAAEGVHVPNSLDGDIQPFHDGMQITVSNPTQIGGIYMQADLKIFDDRTANAFSGIYDNLTYSNNLIIQAGARTKDAVNFTFSYASTSIGGLESDLNCTAEGLGLDKLSLASQETANNAIDKLDRALNKVTLVRCTFGSVQNRLEHKIDNLNNNYENISAAESRIRDADMAKEWMDFTKEQILTNASQSMFAQANSLPNGIMSLLSG